MDAMSKSKEELENLRQNLEGIKRREGIIGYILRASDSASIDLTDPNKIIDYAVLSAAALEEAVNIANTFEIGEISNTILEGEKIKVLLVRVGDYSLSVFMEKNVDHNMLCKELNLA